MSGYHISNIPRGKAGELSKVLEEVHEAMDADQQGVKLMVLQELSDLYGAIELVLEKQYPGFTMEDLRQMSYVTRRAFVSGHRIARD